MANGRFVNVSIAEDDRLGKLSPMAELVYLKTIPHLDRDGMITGKPGLLYSKTHPLREELFGQTQAFIDEWVAIGLVIPFSSSEGPVLFFPGFAKNNKLPHYEREKPSRFPPPPGFARGELGLYPAHKSPPVKTPRKPKGNVESPDSILDEVQELVQDEVQDGILDEVRELLQDTVPNLVDEVRELVPILAAQLEVEDQVEVEVKRMNERMNEYAPEKEKPFIHSLPTDKQMEIDDCIDLLTDPEVGLDDEGARVLAGAFGFDAIERQVFAWLEHRDKGGSFSTTGALINRIKRNFSAPALTAEQKRSGLYWRFHKASYSGGEGRRHRDYGEAQP